MKIVVAKADNPVAIIGTGPSGVAAAWALEDLNCEFEVLDSDLNEESESYDTSNRLLQKEIKLKFGSDLPYRHFKFGPTIDFGDTKMKSSFTKGGLSEVWGATLLPYQKKTIENWGLLWADFESAYGYILKKIPYASYSRNLQSYFEEFGIPKKMEINPAFHLASGNPMTSQEIEFGSSRLAIKMADADTPGCYYCNQCLSGCSSGYIWSARHNRSKPRTDNSKLVSGVRIIKIYERNLELYAQVVTSANKLLELGPYSKIFLACGPVETFRILSESDFLPKESSILDSPTFYFPLLSRKSTATVNEKGIALSQIYCHLQGSKDKKEYHFQIYAKSDDLMKRILNTLPFARYFPAFMLRKVTERLMICIGYRESNSDTQITMVRTDDGNIVCKNAYTVSRSKLKSEARKRLLENARKFWNAGFFFPGIGIKVGAAGEGVHYGANLKINSEITNSGKVIGTSGIYVVDSSTLQSIAAGPITMTIMANAFRITKDAFK